MPVAVFCPAEPGLSADLGALILDTPRQFDGDVVRRFDETGRGLKVFFKQAGGLRCAPEAFGRQNKGLRVAVGFSRFAALIKALGQQT